MSLLFLPGGGWRWYDRNIQAKSRTVTLAKGIFQAKSHIFFHPSPRLSPLQTKSLFLRLPDWLALSLPLSVIKTKQIKLFNPHRLPACMSSTDDLTISSRNVAGCPTSVPTNNDQLQSSRWLRWLRVWLDCSQLSIQTSRLSSLSTLEPQPLSRQPGAPQPPL